MMVVSQYLKIIHCVEIIQMRSFFWSVFSRIRIKYRVILSIFQYSVRMRKNTDKKKLCIWTFFTQCYWYSPSMSS